MLWCLSIYTAKKIWIFMMPMIISPRRSPFCAYWCRVALKSHLPQKSIWVPHLQLCTAWAWGRIGRYICNRTLSFPWNEKLRTTRATCYYLGVLSLGVLSLGDGPCFDIAWCGWQSLCGWGSGIGTLSTLTASGWASDLSHGGARS